MKRSPTAGGISVAGGTLACMLLALLLAALASPTASAALRTICRNETVTEAVEEENSCYVSWLWTECGRSWINKTFVKEVCYNVTDIRQLPPLPTTAGPTTPGRPPTLPSTPAPSRPPARQADPPVPSRQPDRPQPNRQQQQQQQQAEVPTTVRQQPEPAGRKPEQQLPTDNAQMPPGQYGAGMDNPDMLGGFPGIDINNLPVIDISPPGKDGCYNETRFLATYETDPECSIFSRLLNSCYRPVNKTIVRRRCNGYHMRTSVTSSQMAADDGKLTDAEILSVATITTLVVAIAITIASITAKQRMRRRKSRSPTEEELKVFDRCAMDSIAGTPASPVLKSSVTYNRPAPGSSDPCAPLLHKLATSTAGTEQGQQQQPHLQGGTCSGVASAPATQPCLTTCDKTELPATGGAEAAASADSGAAASGTVPCVDAREPPLPAEWENCRETRA